MPSDINETIAEVLRLDAEATQGPWDYWFEVGTRLGPSREHPVALVKQLRHARCPGGVRGAGVDADASLIAYYRTAAPALAREVQRLQAEVDNKHILDSLTLEQGLRHPFEEAAARLYAERKKKERAGSCSGVRGTCPDCGGRVRWADPERTGHAPDCALAACLRAAEVE